MTTFRSVCADLPQVDVVIEVLLPCEVQQLTIITYTAATCLRLSTNMSLYVIICMVCVRVVEGGG